MLHNPGTMQSAVGNAVHFQFNPLQILIHETGWRGNLNGGGHIFLKVFNVVDDLHSPPTQDIGRADQCRITDPCGNCLSLLYGKRGSSRGTGYAQVLQQIIEAPAVFRSVNIGYGGAQDGDAGLFRVRPG